jgi:hypothetical protein
MRAYALLADAQNEIEAIHRSRLWRIAAVYWRLLSFLPRGWPRRPGPVPEGVDKAYFEKKWGVIWRPHQAAGGAAPSASKIGT